MKTPNQRVSGRYTRGYLPHIRLEGRSYFVTFRLEGTLPRELLEKYRRERLELLDQAERAGHALSSSEQKRLFELYSERVERHLDAGCGDCWLKQKSIANLVAHALQFFDQERYELGPWIVMPNHVHAVVRPLGRHALDSILQSWKGFTAREANKVLERTGHHFWAREYYDYWLRDDEERKRVSAYIHHNPRKAGLCEMPEDWPWCSAHPRWQTASLKGSAPADRDVGDTAG
jgi:REP element-mobilizing transposase RayT